MLHVYHLYMTQMQTYFKVVRDSSANNELLFIIMFVVLNRYEHEGSWFKQNLS